MNDFIKYFTDRIAKNKNCNDDSDILKCEIREIMQEILFPELIKTDFFTYNAFQGGTALRMFYGLKRYSDDLDFMMNEDKIDAFSWDKYIYTFREKTNSLVTPF